jgi:hypothetical protein
MADPLDDTINNLTVAPSAPASDSPAPTDPLDETINNLNPASIVMNPGATSQGQTDPTQELKVLGYEGARGASGNLVEKLPDSIVGDVRSQARQFEAEHPYEAKGAQFAGSLVPGMLAPEALPLKGLQGGATLKQAIGANAALGAGFGAASGYGESTDDPIRDTAYGAVTGGAFGAAAPTAQWAIKPALEGLATQIAPRMADTLAMNRIKQRILQGQQSGGPSIDDMRAALQAQPDKPLGLIDVGPDTLKGLAGSVARTPGAPAEAASTFFNDRDVGAMSRILDDIDTHVSSGQDVFTSLQAIDAQKAAQSKPLYDFFRAFRPMSPDEIAPGGELNSLMQTPAMKQAARNAMTIAANRRVDPNTMGITFNEAGDPVFEQVPSWQTLQYMKQGLDDVVGANRNPITGKINWDNQTRATNQVLQDFQDFMTKNNPWWKPANDVWAGHTSTQNAMEWGQDFKQFTPAQIQSRLASMGPSEKDAALVGLADSLRKDVMKTAPTADEAKKILPQGGQQQGWQYQQLEPFFQDRPTFDRWVDRVLTESKMASTKNQVMGNSMTAARAREDQGEGGLLPGIAKLGTGVAAMSHEPYAGASLAYSGARDVLNHMGQPSQRVAEKMAPVLFNSDYATNMQNLRRLGVDPHSPWLPRLMPGIGETAGAIPAGILGSQPGSQP